MTTIIDKSQQPPTRRLRARGKARRENLLDAACQLLTEKTVEEVSFKDIYERAEVPPGSAYHFFENLEAVHVGLMERFGQKFLSTLTTPFKPEETNTWCDLVDTLTIRAADYYAENPVARQVYMGATLPQGTITKENLAIGKVVEELFSEHFKLPEIKNQSLVFTLYPKLVNQVFAVSVTNHGTITPDLMEEATTVGKGYLKMYLPEKLPKRIRHTTAPEASTE